VAADMLWRQKGAQEQTNLRTQQTQELQRLEAELKALTDQLAAERLRREALERSLSEGRK
jgi:Skp family chaperone for outer membrane proteins